MAKVEHILDSQLKTGGPLLYLTSLQLADGHHAVIGRRLPQSEGFIVADGGADGEEGVGGQTPNLALHVTLQTHIHTSTLISGRTYTECMFIKKSSSCPPLCL